MGCTTARDRERAKDRGMARAGGRDGGRDKKRDWAEMDRGRDDRDRDADCANGKVRGLD